MILSFICEAIFYSCLTDMLKKYFICDLCLITYLQNNPRTELYFYVSYVILQSLVEKLMMRQNSSISSTFRRKEKPVVSTMEKKTTYDTAANSGRLLKPFPGQAC